MIGHYFVRAGYKEKERKCRFGENNARGVYIRLVTNESIFINTKRWENYF